MTTYSVLDIQVSAVNPDLAFSVIRDLVASRAKAYVCVAPVSTIVDARRDPQYRAVVNAAAMVTPDGAPVAWLGRWHGHKSVRRTYGPDLMLQVCAEGRAQGFRHFFYGASAPVCDRLEHNLRSRFPGIHIAGKIAPPYISKAAVLADAVIKEINAARPDVLWVGLGSPKQDLWMALNRAALDVPVMIGIGAAFDFIAGEKPQAPGWMRACALEWLFRLCCEPRRLWKRYLLGNTLFIFWLIKDAVFKRR
ncbi:MAG: WecB/TagA/CpsF family glycosyltransferase [Candidatus Omnitrophica bacterium]|nr:WecB/TagA/CpsF family glycosyltransferase [Candidatus Omnitrophota bacterium]